MARLVLLGSGPAGLPPGQLRVLLGMATALRTEPDRVAELTVALRTSAIPCLVVFGESDDAWPVSMQREMAARLGAEVAEIPGAAHYPNTENPQAQLDVLLPTWMSWLATTLTP